MKRRVILGGQLRGNINNWNKLQEFFSLLSAEVYVSSYTEWKEVPFKHHYTETKSFLNPTCFTYLTHPHSGRYEEQWKSLYTCYSTFSPLFEEDDIIFKLRNDIYLESPLDILLELQIKDNCLYTPNTEFHMDCPFDTNIVCNDQFYIFKKSVADKIFNLPYNFIFDSDKNIDIESILRNYISQQNINLETFEFKYSRV
jgi:hypothetical protein